MEPRIQFAKTGDGVAIAYAIVGQGPPVLIARPFLAPGLDHEIPELREETSLWLSGLWTLLTDSHSVVFWDLRGVGLSGSVSEFRFDDWIADIDAVADAAGAGRFDLVGGTGPSCLAVAYAARQPERVNRLVLYAPTPPGTSPRQVQPAWLNALASENWDDFIDIFALRLFGWRPAAERWARRMHTNFTPDRFLNLMDVLESIDVTPDARRVGAPTLVIDDRALHPRSSQAARH
jgi:pimeloyl-ACP methyl ester carboxylesterase